MQTNRDIFNQLIREDKIEIQRSDLFDHAPEPISHDSIFDRVQGMMLGLAIGDALGNTTEGLLPETRSEYVGEIRGYLPNQYAGNAEKGLPTDDTQMAFWTLEKVLADGEFIPKNLADRFCKEQIFGLGSTVRQFIINCKSGTPWYESGPHSAGNGALMRIAPMLIPYIKKGSADLWIDTALSAMITHKDTGSIAACLAFVYMYRELMQMDTPPEPHWWIDTYVKIAKNLEIWKAYKPRGGFFMNYSGPIWAFVDEKVRHTFDQNLPTINALNSWYSGAFLLETVPCALYILMKHAHNPEEAIVRAVNDTKDNDTIAAIVGAAVGALHGKEKLPRRWIDNLVGRTSFDDDGRIFNILEEAKHLNRG